MDLGFKKIYFSGRKMLVILSCLILSGLFSVSTAFGDCPQERKTKSAPAKFIKIKNPLPADAANIKAGEKLYLHQAKPIACQFCHGVKGDGQGDPNFASTPPARNFACTKTMKTLPDGQLFWIIKSGSKNTSMFAFSDLSDDQVWQVIHYVRQFAK